MTRTHGRCLRGQRHIAKVPHGRWRTQVFIAAMRHDRMDADSRKRQAIRPAIRGVGARLLFLPPYSPDLNPIAQVLAKT